MFYSRNLDETSRPDKRLTQPHQCLEASLNPGLIISPALNTPAVFYHFKSLFLSLFLDPWLCKQQVWVQE